ncbi:MAG: hypothetical protein K6G11_10285 [Lachnospiraceae bacterium]|nr:hypothetical protein [Lachnospiraceae bacterium]
MLLKNQLLKRIGLMTLCFSSLAVVGCNKNSTYRFDLGRSRTLASVDDTSTSNDTGGDTSSGNKTSETSSDSTPAKTEEPAPTVTPFSEIKKEIKLEKNEHNEVFSQSIFTGSSIIMGLDLYFKTKDSSYLGGPLIVSKESYNLQGDIGPDTSLQLVYNGIPYTIANLVQATQKKYAFIQMGINDLNIFGLEDTIKYYKKYINSVHKVNPDVVIFIEATTPTVKDAYSLSNENIDILNDEMAKFALKQKDMYFIDINTPLKDENGILKYSSDGFVHISMDGYKIWMKKVVKKVDNYMLNIEYANKAVEYAEEQLDPNIYQEAVDAVDALGKSDLKTELKDKLKDIKDKCV